MSELFPDPAEMPHSPGDSRLFRRNAFLLGGVLLATGLITAVSIKNYRAHLEAERKNLSTAPTGHRKNAPYIVSPQDVVDLMLRVGELETEDVIYDLGCGDGRIVITAAKRFGCRGVGYEYDAGLAELARQKVKEAGVEHLVTIYQMDIFKISKQELNEASVITLYLLDWMNKKLIPQLREIDDDKLIISHDWGLAGIEPNRIEQIDSTDDPEKKRHVVRVWRTPLGPASEHGDSSGAANSKENSGNNNQ